MSGSEASRRGHRRGANGMPFRGLQITRETAMDSSSNPLRSTIQSSQTALVSGFDGTGVISMTWPDEMRSTVGI
jgi:hypothetical protein